MKKQTAEVVVETVEFNGNTYRRYPESKRRQHRVYFQYHDCSKKSPRYLHRDVWMFHNGPIPKGHHIHHVDGNPLNNSINNLMCVDEATHRKLDAERGANRTPAVVANLARIRPLAAAWHATEEGKKWHSENSKRSWESRQPTDLVCRLCKSPFQSLVSDTQICSNKCAAAERRASGVDDVQRTCVECNTAFNINKYKKTRTCGYVCGRALAWRTRSGK
jgi:hypothetical protein